MNSDVSVDVQSVMRRATLQATIRVTGTKRLMLRVFIARALVRLAAWVLGCNVAIDDTRLVTKKEGEACSAPLSK